jgi:ZIP family zinc transporter
MEIFFALAATIGTWLATALGSASVFFFRRQQKRILNLLLGFAAGVMLSASFWSLLQPAVELSSELGIYPNISVTLGFTTGLLFIWGIDKIVSRASVFSNYYSTSTLPGSISNISSIEPSREIVQSSNPIKRSLLLILAITLHNIPEGLAVGVAFGAAKNSETPTATLISAGILALGIALQNLPEGAAVSLPLHRDGISRAKSFFIGQASGIVEPIAGVLGALLVSQMSNLLPFALSFAAGAMILVTIHELLPESQSDNSIPPYVITFSIIGGFVLMMSLDLLFVI